MLEPESVTCVMGHASTGAGAASADRLALWAGRSPCGRFYEQCCNFIRLV